MAIIETSLTNEILTIKSYISELFSAEDSERVSEALSHKSHGELIRLANACRVVKEFKDELK